MTLKDEQEINKNLPNYWNSWKQPLRPTALEINVKKKNKADGINTDISTEFVYQYKKIQS